MTPRLLHGFLKHGDKTLDLPHAPRTGRPDLPPVHPGDRTDPRTASEALALDWLWHVREGRIGGG